MRPLHQRPIFVTGPARSGTSMVAGLLAAHGVWVGTSTKQGRLNPRGWFENDKFLNLTRDGIGSKGPVPDSWWNTWPGIMRDDGLADGERWLVKAMPWAWKYLYRFEPIVVFCWRPATQIIRSQESAGWHEDGRRRRVLQHWDQMRDIKFKADSVDIPTDKLARREYAHTRWAFGSLGITLNTRIADKWIEPAYWNRNAR